MLTVATEAIDGRPDRDLAACLPSSVRVVRAPTMPVHRARVAGVGDLGIRALRGLYRAGRELLAREPFHAVLITTYPIYPAWLGPRFKKQTGVPFVLDLQDPWVGAWGRTLGPGGRPDLRSRLSRRVAVTLERSIVPRADALVAVSSGTLDELASRVPSIRSRPLLELPIGWNPADFERARSRAANAAEADGRATFSYIGTLLPAGHDIIAALFAGAGRMLAASPRPLRLQFVGTSNQTQYSGRPLLDGMIPAGLEDVVVERAERLPYFDALRTLTSSDVVMVIGTRQPHYTASKVYPALASGRPVLALVHEASQATPILRQAAGTVVVAFDDRTPADAVARAVADGMRDALALVSRAPFDRANVLDAYRGDVLARRLADLLDGVAVASRSEAHA